MNLYFSAYLYIYLLTSINVRNFRLSVRTSRCFANFYLPFRLIEGLFCRL